MKSLGKIITSKNKEKLQKEIDELVEKAPYSQPIQQLKAHDGENPYAAMQAYQWFSNPIELSDDNIMKDIITVGSIKLKKVKKSKKKNKGIKPLPIKKTKLKKEDKIPTLEDILKEPKGKKKDKNLKDVDSAITAASNTENNKTPITKSKSSKSKAKRKAKKKRASKKDVIINQSPIIITKKVKAPKTKSKDKKSKAVELDDYTQWLNSLQGSKVIHTDIPEGPLKSKKEKAVIKEESESKKPSKKLSSKAKKKKKKISKKSRLEKKIAASIKGNEKIVSKSLAKLYAKQGHRKKAIKVYEALSLINPKKSAFFAAQIEKLKNRK